MRHATHLSLKTARRLTYYVLITVLASVTTYLITCRGMRVFMVPSASMAPSLLPKDYIVTLEDDGYHRGDVVVVTDPNDNEGFLVKRVVTVGRETVSARGGALFIDGEYASEPYLTEAMAYTFPSITVPEDELFLLGDNRNLSQDSHDELETFPLERVVGRVRFIYLPLSRMGPFPSYPLTNALGE